MDRATPAEQTQALNEEIRHSAVLLGLALGLIGGLALVLLLLTTWLGG